MCEGCESKKCKIPGIRARVRGTDEKAGLLLAYEKTGYDTTSTKRLPDCLDVWSAKRIKEQGADAVKFLLYYDVDSSDELNQQKQWHGVHWADKVPMVL